MCVCGCVCACVGARARVCVYGGEGVRRPAPHRARVTGGRPTPRPTTRACRLSRAPLSFCLPRFPPTPTHPASASVMFASWCVLAWLGLAWPGLAWLGLVPRRPTVRQVHKRGLHLQRRTHAWCRDCARARRRRRPLRLSPDNRPRGTHYLATRPDDGPRGTRPVKERYSCTFKRQRRGHFLDHDFVNSSNHSSNHLPLQPRTTSKGLHVGPQ